MRRTATTPRMDALSPAKSPAAAAMLEVFRRAARTEGAAREIWHAHIDDLYGDLTGQRALARDPAIRTNHGDLRDQVQALQCYFVLIADLVAASRLRRSDAPSSLSPRKLRAFLASLSAGEAWQKWGIAGASTPVPFDGYVAHLRKGDEEPLRAVLAAAEALAADDIAPGTDVMQPLYASLMPRNLLHATGEFYTPDWLAELLLDDAGWQPGHTLLDPFVGSGVFLLAALARGSRLRLRARDTRSTQASLSQILPHLAGIDRNPVACVAARANLLLHLADTFGDNPVTLPIACGDSLLSDLSPLPAPADVLATNPPWVGWEYLPRAYRARLTSEWTRYDLYTARGRDAAFLKEDLSTLAVVSVWDRFLKPGGISAVVLRPAAMQSHLAARGLRRLSLHDNSDPLNLRRIRLFPGLRLFGAAQAPGAAWLITKLRGEPGVSPGREARGEGVNHTESEVCPRGDHTSGASHRGRTPPGSPVAPSGTSFPIPVIEWHPRVGWQPPPGASLAQVRENIVERELAATRSDPAAPGSAWSIGPVGPLQAATALAGKNAYRVRTGVFTGGANGVYYVQRKGPGSTPGLGRYRNCPDGARRPAPAVECELEDALVHEVVRGRDLELWNAQPGACILCPHTADTRMQAISSERLGVDYPAALRYLRSMRAVLDARNGFSGWERKQREQSFYALQRIGDYTFAPYKVAWRYIAADFIVAVIGLAPDGRPRFGNDKVMYVACADVDEAFFLCGLLSSDPVRWCVTATMTGTQISTSAIRHLALPSFDANDVQHRRIARRCREGHGAAQGGDRASAQTALDSINDSVARMYHLSAVQMANFARGPRF